MAVQLDTKYTFKLLSSPNVIAVIDNGAIGEPGVGAVDANYCGIPTDIKIGPAETRETTDNVPGGDGGVHGDFFRGRLPFVMEGLFLPDPSSSLNSRMDKLIAATDAAHVDCELSWTETGRAATRLLLRVSQGVLLGSPRPKSFTLAMVQADWRVHALAAHGSTALSNGMSAPNAGTAPAPPIIVLTAGTAGDTLTCGGKSIMIDSTFSGISVTIDVLARTVYATGTQTWRGNLLRFPETTLWEIPPGGGTINKSSGISGTIDWRDAWKA